MSPSFAFLRIFLRELRGFAVLFLPGKPAARCLSWLSLLSLVLLITSTARAAEPSTRPSILFAIADDWSYPHAGAYGDTVVHTATFDRVAAEGVLFTHAFCVSPS